MMTTRARTALLAMLVTLPCSAFALESEAVVGERAFLKRLGDAVKNIQEAFPGYLARSTDDDLFVSAITGLLRDADPTGHSFVTREGEDGPGEGELMPAIQVGVHDGVPTIDGVLPHSLAFVSALSPGDILVKIGNQQVLGSSLPAIQKLLSGPADSEVEVTVINPKSTSLITEKLVRSSGTPRVLTRPISEKVAYIQLTGVDAATVQSFVATLRETVTESVRGLILDLRNCHGGNAEDALKIADPFYTEGSSVIVKIQDSNGTSTLSATAKTDAIKVPIIVVQNQGTSDAAEVICASFQANRRALLLGTRTNGNAGQITTRDLGGKLKLHFVSSLYQTPGGRVISGQGVRPDIGEDESELTGKQLVRLRREFSLFAQGLGSQAKNPLIGEKEPEKQDETAARIEEVKSQEDGVEPTSDPNEGVDSEGSDPEAKDDSTEESPSDEASETESEALGSDSSTAVENPGEHQKTLTKLAEDYPMIKRYDAQLMRAVNLLISTTVFFDQFLKN